MTLHDLNTLPAQQLKDELRKCCGSSAWVNKMLPFFPAEDLVEILEDAEEQWYKCSRDDWKEAFTHHPRIGDVESLKKKFTSTGDPVTKGWASAEQSGVNTASEQTIRALAKANEEYEKKFGYIFIVCATGKSAEEMLGMLESRLLNSLDDEIEIAADEQNKITKLRLEKLLDD
ncbi:MAG: 2-oxo-4-hydroxy-4-carboxy-5-ureidoimidazoline decarboxylase [Chitinophagales bacterium]